MMLSDQRSEELAEAMQIVFHWLRKPDTTPLKVHSPQLASANCLKHLHHFDRQTTVIPFYPVLFLRRLHHRR